MMQIATGSVMDVRSLVLSCANAPHHTVMMVLLKASKRLIKVREFKEMIYNLC